MSNGQTNQDQLDRFSQEISKQTRLPAVGLKDWSDAFHLLSTQTEQDHCVILLDEISWMGHYDRDFPGKLKIAWDTLLKKNTKLRLILCGSVSSWIQKNILNSTDFIGRISLTMALQELSLRDSLAFFGRKAEKTSELEKVRILALTGGVPRYLEEIDYSSSAEENYRNLCFNRYGFLFHEFERIFTDIFARRSHSYREIVVSLLDGPKSLTQISQVTHLNANGILSEYLQDLELSGFIRKEIMWNIKSGKSTAKIARYRLVDCYVRFYFKFIFPNRQRIEKDLFKTVAIERLAQFDIVVGLQFETLLTNNLLTILKHLGVREESVLQCGPYLQTATARKKGCQIDLLIQTKTTLYVCEFKARQTISKEVCEEVRNKIKSLKYPGNFSIRPVLIYAGSLQKDVEDAEFFDKILSFNQLTR